MNNQLYKPSNKAPVIGLVVLFLALSAVAIGIFWIYEIIEGWMPLIYLNILMAVGAGVAVGAIGGKLVKSFKLRAPVVVLIVTCAAMLFASYVRAAIYVSRDWEKNYYSFLKDYNMGEMLANVPDSEIDAWNGEDEQSQLLYSMIASISADSDDDEEVQMVKNLFGNSVDDFKANIKRIKNEKMTFYEVYFDICKAEKRTAFYLVMHPGKLFEDLKNINEVGRWSIKSHRYGLSDTDRESVKGFLLWFVWLGELLILTVIPVWWAFDKSRYPFIESEDEWAAEEKPMPDFKFDGPDSGRGAGEQAFVKAETLKDPNYLFTLPAIPIIAPMPDEYYKVTYCRSRYFDENYITVAYSKLVNARKNQRRQQVLVKNMRVDADFIATLYGTFECTVPALCKGTNRAKEVNAANEERKQAAESGRPLSPTPPKATGAEAIFDEPLNFSRPKPKPAERGDDFIAKQMAEEQKQASTPRPTSGDMDSLDTSNLALSHFDFKS